MENQQTAVEWLIRQIKGYESDCEIFEEAKEMEKKQREKDFVEGYKTRALASNLIFDEKSEYFAKKLFNRTFKSE